MVHRLFWVAVGAAGGIVAYRKGTRLMADARERGMVGNVAAAVSGAQTVAGSATAMLAQARELRAAPTRPRAAAPTPEPLPPLPPSDRVRRPASPAAEVPSNRMGA